LLLIVAARAPGLFPTINFQKTLSSPPSLKHVCIFVFGSNCFCFDIIVAHGVLLPQESREMFLFVPVSAAENSPLPPLVGLISFGVPASCFVFH
jgi:hypothetical protein